MSDNSEDSFIKSTSRPWYQSIPTAIWTAIIGGTAAIIAAAVPFMLAPSSSVPAVDPTPTVAVSVAVDPTPTAVVSEAVDPTPTTESVAMDPTPTTESDVAVDPTPTVIVEPAEATRAPIVCESITTIHQEFKLLYEKHKDRLRCPDPDTPFNVPVELGEQHFQGGHIFWVGGDNQWMFVVFDQSKATGAELPEGEWFSTIGPRNNPYPEDLHDTKEYPDGIGLVPPSPDLLEPIGGMGWLWRTHLGREDGELGWAQEKVKESKNEGVGLYQEFERGVMFKGRDPKVYVLLDTGAFYAERPAE